MNIQVALQNTIAKFEGLAVEHIGKQGTLWRIKIAKGDAELEFEIDEISCCPCVLERKNLGYKSVSRFMTTFLEEIEDLVDEDGNDGFSEDEDPVAPAQD